MRWFRSKQEILIIYVLGTYDEVEATKKSLSKTMLRYIIRI